MSVIFLLIPLSIVIATVFLLAFIWAVRSGQYEDTCTPSMRLLLDEQKPGRPLTPSRSSAEGEELAKGRVSGNHLTDVASDPNLKPK
jgi:cbb3-type cytochrome oxidase maturation protein